MSAIIVNSGNPVSQSFRDLIRARASATRCAAKRWATALGCSHRTVEDRLHRTGRWDIEDVLRLADEDKAIRDALVTRILAKTPEQRAAILAALEETDERNDDT